VSKRLETLKPGVLVTAAIAVAAVGVRLTGAEPLADLIATGYLASATVTCAPSWSLRRVGSSAASGARQRT
jgi:hypothetical protein